MNAIFGFGIFALGIVLLIFGLSGTQTLLSAIGNLFPAAVEHQSRWMVLCGIAAVASGLFLVYKSAPRS